MTLDVRQGRSSFASFSILTSASRGPSAIAELLVYLYDVLAFKMHVEAVAKLFCVDLFISRHQGRF